VSAGPTSFLARRDDVGTPLRGFAHPTLSLARLCKDALTGASAEEQKQRLRFRRRCR
jgi:hypothetical protein